MAATASTLSVEEQKAALPKLERLPGYSIWVMIMSVLCFMCFYIVMNCTNVFGVLIKEQMGINATQLSLLGTGTMITFCLGPMFLSKYAENLGIKIYVPIALGVNIVCGLMLLMPWAQTYWGYFVTRFLAGFAGMINGPLAGQLCMWFPKKGRGFATGVMIGALGVGFTVTALLANPLLEAGFDWIHSTVILSTVPSIVIGLIYIFGVKDFRDVYPGAESVDDLLPEQDDSKRSHRFDNLPKPATNAEVWRDKRLWFAATFIATTGVIVYGLGYTLPLFFQNDLGLSLAESSAIIAATFIWKIVASPTGGFMSDVLFRGERYQTDMIGNAAAGVMMFVTIFVANSTGGDVGIITVMIIITFFCASIYGGTFKTFPLELAQPSAVYAASGMLVGVANIGSLITTPICGALIDATGTAAAALVFLGIVAFIGVPLAKRIND